MREAAKKHFFFKGGGEGHVIYEKRKKCFCPNGAVIKNRTFFYYSAKNGTLSNSYLFWCEMPPPGPRPLL